MLVIKTKLTFIKRHKKTKSGKKIYKKKYFRSLYVNDIHVGMVTKVSITRGAGKLIEPIKPENCMGYNKELYEFFKANPPIPIDVIENVSKGSFDKLNDDNLPEGFEISFSEDINKKLVKEHIEFLENLNIDAVITLDLDDVIYDLMKRNISFVEEVYGVKDVHLEITDYYYLYRTYPRIAEELWNHPENYISSELIEGAIEFYNELVELVGGEDRIQIVTSSMENVIPLKNRMIKETFGFNCKVIHSIFGKYEKHIFTKGTFLIEDHVGNLKDHTTRNQCGGVIFNHMKLSYIEVLCKQEGFEHVTTYKEVLESVKSYLSVKKCLKNLNFI